MSRCVLHIGWNKTGTTSIQQRAFKHRDALSAAGISYPGWHHNHGAALVAAFRQGGGYYFAETFVPPRAKYAHVTRAEWGRAEFAQAISGAEHKTLLLSGEDLSLLRAEEISMLAEALRGHFETVEVVAYIRRHREYLHSTVQQLVRMGFSISKTLQMAQNAPDETDNLRVMNPIPDYGRKLGNWMSVFGRGNVHVHDYDQLRKAGRDVAAHFFDTHFGLDIRSVFPEGAPRKSNSSFSAPAIHLLDAMHQERPLFVDGVPNPKFLFNAQRFYAGLSGPAFLADTAFEQPCNLGRARDQQAFESLFAEGAWDSLFQDTAPWDACSYVPLPEDIASTLENTANAATVSQAREKFFAALNMLAMDPADGGAMGNLHIALFNLTDPVALRSCAGWLVRQGHYEMAALYLEKAQNVGVPAGALSKLWAQTRNHLSAR